jgi:hypothetical protein
VKNKKRKVKSGVIATFGYLLSPLCWWNDIYFNMPLAYVFAFPFGLISEKLFVPMLIVGYWLSNMVGFMLMRYGATDLVSEEKMKYTKKEFIKDVALSVAYTLVIVAFIKIGWLKFPLEYFK